MKSIIRFFVERHLLANLLIVMILILGISSAMRIKRDAWPNVDLDELIITTRYPGASPEDVELNVTNKLEDELKNVDGIDEMTSTSLENISVVNIKIDPDESDKEKVKRDIRDAINRVTDLPTEVTEAPYIFEIKSENFEVLWVGIGGDIPYSELRELAKQFEKKLENVKGVSKISKTGFLDREIKVEVSKKAIEEYQIPLREFVAAIKARNIQATGGSFESYTSDKNIVTMAQFREPREAGEVIVRSTFEGRHIKIKDVADIEDGFEPEKTRFHMNGEPVIAFTVYKKGSADIIRVVDAVRKLVETEKENMPAEVKLMYSSDQSRFVRNRLGIMANNAFIGLGLVCIVLLIFLNFRTAFWVAMGIPLTVMGVVFLAPFFDVHIELVSLIGMVIIVGLIVDDAIVIAENIHRHQEMGKPPIDAAVDGAYGVLRPVTATILTTALAFGTMFFMTGMMGKFVFSIPLVIILALLVSYGEAMTILPSHIMTGMQNRARRLLKKGARGERRSSEYNWFKKVRIKFRHFIKSVLIFRYIVVFVFLGLLVGAIFYAKNHMKFILFPGNVSDSFFVTIELPTGSSLDATSDKVKEIEKMISALPENELDSYWTLVGSQGGGLGGVTPPGESENWALIFTTLTPYSERDRSAENIVEGLRAETDKLTGFDAIRYIIEEGGPPVGRPIAIRVVGTDDDVRTNLADSITSYLASIDGVSDIDRDDKLGKEQVEIIINYPRLAELELTVADIAQTVRLAYDGQVVTRVRYGDEDVGFRVILEESERKRPGYLGDLKIPNKRNRLIPLKNVARFEIGPGPSRYFHYDNERSVAITADLAEGGITPLEATMATINNFDLKDYPGMKFVIGGEAEETQDSVINLGFTMIIAAIGIYFILVLLFNSLTQPLLVMVAIPFGMIGVIGAFAMHAEPLGFMSMMGVIGLMGVVVNDSLILVNYINERRKGEPESRLLVIVADGTATRLRPIILTSITTVAGVLPLAYGLGGSDPFISPMALALGYGILFATPLTLILLPCLYLAQHDVGKLLKYIFKRS
ncbi:MAG: efflux RND transporter permease subunit [Candidatus Zixiibacteriota bacterium]|nr:MAG: efflux RND transporter permease subunit [candidate division Zixibacteria bacterium]